MGSLIQRVVNLCKRRGLVFQTAELYGGGLRGCYDYGPYGALLKRNLAAQWWRDMVTRRGDVLPLDTALLTPRSVLETSGHVNNFTDPLVDCKLTKERFRADRAPPVEVHNGALVIRASSNTEAAEWVKAIQERLAPGAKVTKGAKASSPSVVLSVVRQTATSLELEPAAPAAEPVVVPYAGYAAPSSNSPFLTPSRQFNLMFSTTLGPLDPLEDIVDTVLRNASASRDQILAAARERVAKSTVFLRPETAQGAFAQYHNVLQTHSPKLPFGLAQIGKSFRNEITVEHFIFRTAEFEQMELQYFCEPETSSEVFAHWRAERLRWWKWLLRNNGETHLRLVDHPKEALAHYSSACTDIEFLYPWGWGELEGVAHRGDFDLRAHGKALDVNMAAQRREGTDRTVPHTIEPAAGLNRGVLAVLLDAYSEETKTSPSSSAEELRILLRLHPRLAPIKAGVFPLRASDEKATALAHDLAQRLRDLDYPSRVDLSGSIGKRYARQDELGTPFCITIDPQTSEDSKVTLRHRDSTQQERVHVDDVVPLIHSYISSEDQHSIL